MSQKSYRLAVLAGDGIGPEVMTEALKVLTKISEKFNTVFEVREALVGGAAIDATGQPLPLETLRLCQESVAILFGSVGGPQWDQLPRDKRPEIGSLLQLRQHFNLFANLRPVKIFAELKNASPLHPSRVGEGFEYLVIRELTGDVYFAEPKERKDGYALDTMKYARSEVERIARVAFLAAKKRRNKVTSIDKANVLTVSQFWREIVEDIHRKEFSDVELSHLYVDNAAMQLILNPHQFDVVLCPNMFGDILSDEAGATTGSIGMLPSASLNEKGFGLYEPSGGSAPDIAGKGIANPSAQILSVALMLRYSFGLKEAAEAIEQAVEKTLTDGIRTVDIMGEGCRKVGTAEFGDAVVRNLE